MKSLLGNVLVLVGFATMAAFARADDGAPKPKILYTLVTDDRIHVEIYQQPDLAAETKIDAQGNINLNLVGNVAVAGLTVEEAQKAVENAYKNGEFLRHPQATITITEYAERMVSIEGQVKSPGRYTLPIGTPFGVADLVDKAGGWTDTANGSNVTVTHKEAGGKDTQINLDVKAIIKGKKSNDIQLQPGDRVFVPESII